MLFKFFIMVQSLLFIEAGVGDRSRWKKYPEPVKNIPRAGQKRTGSATLQPYLFKWKTYHCCGSGSIESVSFPWIRINNGLDPESGSVSNVTDGTESFFCPDPYRFCLDPDPNQSSVWIRIRNEFLHILDPDPYQNDTDQPHCRLSVGTILRTIYASSRNLYKKCSGWF